MDFQFKMKTGKDNFNGKYNDCLNSYGKGLKFVFDCRIFASVKLSPLLFNTLQYRTHCSYTVNERETIISIYMVPIGRIDFFCLEY